ncbi:unnamed protein product [Amoebophrya sp. A120]|nr:unnamed protein product [Amoebophrya sp. A120]|eukprot:GSA120T00006938001.1
MTMLGLVTSVSLCLLRGHLQLPTRPTSGKRHNFISSKTSAASTYQHSTSLLLH